MLNTPDLLKIPNNAGELALKALLEQVSVVDAVNVIPNDGAVNSVDFTVEIRSNGITYRLACEILSNGQPRYASSAMLHLRHAIIQEGDRTVPLLVAPYLSPATRETCKKNHVCYLDMQGNAWISFGGIYIDREVAERPRTEKRELKSLFKPRSAQVLKALLHDPEKSWRVIELAKATGVSLGHVSNVRSALLDREWAAKGTEGIYLANPDGLLDAWRENYETASGTRKTYYTTLHGIALEKAAREALAKSKSSYWLAAFASFSAANWLSPYGRTGTSYFYATESGAEVLKKALQLAPQGTGWNVTITIPDDPVVFSDLQEPAPGAVCTSLIQTYLDLSVAGERGLESAEYLREQRMRWTK